MRVRDRSRQLATELRVECFPLNQNPDAPNIRLIYVYANLDVLDGITGRLPPWFIGNFGLSFVLAVFAG